MATFKNCLKIPNRFEENYKDRGIIVCYFSYKVCHAGTIRIICDTQKQHKVYPIWHTKFIIQ